MAMDMHDIAMAARLAANMTGEGGDFSDVQDQINGLRSQISAKAPAESSVAMISTVEKSLETTEGHALLTGWTKNLFDVSSLNLSKNGITAVGNPDGSITINGTTTANTTIPFTPSNPQMPVSEIPEILTISGGESDNIRAGCQISTNPNGGSVNSFYSTGSPTVVNTSAYRDKYVFFFVYISTGMTLENKKVYPMINAGNVVQPFVPYEYDITVCGKNLFGGTALRDSILANVPNSTADDMTVQYTGQNAHNKVIFKTGFKTNTQYTIILYGENTSGTKNKSNICFQYSDGSHTDGFIFSSDTNRNYGRYVSDGNKTLESIIGIWSEGTTILEFEKCGLFEGSIAIDGFTPYTSTTLHLTNDAPSPIIIPTYDNQTNILSPGDVEVVYPKSKQGSAVINAVASIESRIAAIEAIISGEEDLETASIAEHTAVNKLVLETLGETVSPDETLSETLTNEIETNEEEE